MHLRLDEVSLAALISQSHSGQIKAIVLTEKDKSASDGAQAGTQGTNDVTPVEGVPACPLARACVIAAQRAMLKQGNGGE